MKEKKEKRIAKLADAVNEPALSGNKAKGKKFFIGADKIGNDAKDVTDLDPFTLPKVKSEVDPQTMEMVIELPKNQVKPVNGRIFCVETDPGEMKTKSGLILPTDYQAPQARGGRQRRLRRFWVVDVADDVSLKVAGRKLQRGDEVYPFIPNEAEAWSFPIVFDYYLNTSYIVLHETELAGIGNPENIKQDEDD